MTIFPSIEEVYFKYMEINDRFANSFQQKKSSNTFQRVDTFLNFKKKEKEGNN